MHLFLFYLSFILFGCSLGIQKEKEDTPKATDLIDCEGRLKEYSQCLIKFHTKDCDAVKKALEDDNFKKEYFAKANKACGMESVLALCNFNDLKIHTLFHKSVKNRNDKIFKQCGIQQ